MENFTFSVKTVTVKDSLDVQCLLLIKASLGQNGVLDPVLKSSLDYAMKAVEALPIFKRTNAVLDVAGENVLLRIMAGEPVFRYVVWNNGNGLKLLQKIIVQNKVLTMRDIDKSHFAVHQCRDEVWSCMKQARDKVAAKEGGLSNVELKIKCGELHLTYVTQKPSTTIEIQPVWRAKIKTDRIKDILRVMNLMQKSGEMSPGMLACFQHLITHHSRSNPGYNVHILLMCDGQRVEFLFEEDESAKKSHTMIQRNAFNDGNNTENIVIFLGANNTPQMVHNYS